MQIFVQAENVLVDWTFRRLISPLEPGLVATSKVKCVRNLVIFIWNSFETNSIRCLKLCLVFGYFDLPKYKNKCSKVIGNVSHYYLGVQKRLYVFQIWVEKTYYLCHTNLKKIKFYWNFMFMENTAQLKWNES